MKETTTLESASIESFMIKTNMKHVDGRIKARKDTGYPYLQFRRIDPVTGKTSTNNDDKMSVLFSVNAGREVSVGDKVDFAFLSKYVVYKTEQTPGTVLWKIGLYSDSDGLNLDGVNLDDHMTEEEQEKELQKFLSLDIFATL